MRKALRKRQQLEEWMKWIMIRQHALILHKNFVQHRNETLHKYKLVIMAHRFERKLKKHMRRFGRGLAERNLMRIKK